MAAERLDRYLRRQLANLPEDDPDRSHLETMLRANGDYTKATKSKPPALSVEAYLERPGRAEKFSDEAKHVLANAEEEAKRLYHTYVGTEHILLALTRPDARSDDPVVQVFASLNVDPQRVRRTLDFLIGRGDKRDAGRIQPSFTPRAIKAIELAVDETRRQEKSQVDSKTLLLGLVSEGEGIAAGVLESCGINLEKAREAVSRTVSL